MSQKHGDALVEELIQTEQDESVLIEKVATARRWFGATFGGQHQTPAYGIVKRYIAGEISVDEAASLLGDPIDRAYSTADGGRALRDAVEVAIHQREFYDDPEKAIEDWGPEDNAEEFEVDPELEDLPATEGQLWNLYYAILHSSKMIPWDDDASHQKLVDLVRKLKARPDPPPPPIMIKALKRDWIWMSGTLWSHLSLFGASARECWNDCPGCGAGWYPPEARAWQRINSFIARITVQEVHNFDLYGIWAIINAVEDTFRKADDARHTSEAEQVEILLATGYTWLLIAGKRLHEQMVDTDFRPKKLDANKRRDRLRWTEDKRDVITPCRWKWWQERFAREAERESNSERGRDLAQKCLALMKEIEGEKGQT